jgi:hypothetical protein
VCSLFPRRGEPAPTRFFTPTRATASSNAHAGAHASSTPTRAHVLRPSGSRRSNVRQSPCGARLHHRLVIVRPLRAAAASEPSSARLERRLHVAQPLPPPWRTRVNSLLHAHAGDRLFNAHAGARASSTPTRAHALRPSGSRRSNVRQSPCGARLQHRQAASGSRCERALVSPPGASPSRVQPLPPSWRTRANSLLHAHAGDRLFKRPRGRARFFNAHAGDTRFVPAEVVVRP